MEVEIKIEVSEEDDAAEECPVCGGDMQDGTCEDCGYDGATDVQAYSAARTARRIEAVEEAIVTLARSRFFNGKYANETVDNQLQHNARQQQKVVRQKAEELRTQLQTTS